MKIVMVGKLRSGKSTATEIIKELVKEQYNIELISRPLAAPIYKEAKEFYERHQLVWRKNRRLLEGIGEALNDDYPGGDKIVELYNAGFNPEEHILVEDCRRTPQANYFKSKGAVLVRIVAPVEVRKLRCNEGDWSEGHISDTELDHYPVDFEINNDGGSLEEFRNKLRDIVAKFKLYEV